MVQADPITVAEAVAITGLDPVELVGREELSVVDGNLSRAECEDLALQLHRRGDPPGYWMTITQAAKALGISQQYLHKQQLPTRVARHGWRLIRRHDVELLANARRFRRQARDAARG